MSEKELDTGEELDLWQQKTHQYIYMMISKLFENMSFDLTQAEITELIINSLAANLGTLIGQVSDEYREDVMDIAKTALDTNCLTMVKQLAKSKYGNIGHG